MKSFKKVIACLLAVLMVLCSMPFTALAKAGEDAVDIQLLFNPVYTAGYFDYSEVLAAESMFDYTMLQEAPITYDYKYNEETGAVSGTLTLEDAKTKPICKELGVDSLGNDVQLGVGDYFAVTVALKDCPSIYGLMYAISYSENIEPAGTYTRSAKRLTYQGLAGISEKAIDTGSAVGSYYAGLNDGAIGDISEIDYENHVIVGSATVQNGTHGIDTTVVDPGENVYTNPEDGTLKYTFPGLALCSTFIFKIVGEGDISFGMYDVDNTKYEGFKGGALLVDDLNGTLIDQYTTYADNGGAGAMKMTFMGGNVNSGVVPDAGETECKHDKTTVVNKKEATCTEAGYTGDTKCDSCGATVETGKTIDPLDHDMQEVANSAVAATCTEAGKEADMACSRGDKTVTGKRIDPLDHAYGEFAHVADTNTHAKVCANDPSHVVTENCDFASSVKTEPTYTEKGWTTYTCKVCDNTYDAQDIPVKTCDHAKTTVVNKKDATCTEAGYTGDTKCDTCGATVETGKTIDPLDHDMQEVANSAVAATCTEAGKEADMACSRGDKTVTGKRIDPLDHDMQVVPNSAVAATCKTDGKEADMACSRGDKTETGKTISKSTVAHTSKTVNGKTPTCTESGLTTGSICAVCGTVLVEQTEINSLGHTEVSANNAVAPTPAKDGHEADTMCSVCLETVSYGKTIKATGVNVTVDDTYEGLGTVNAGFGVTNYAYNEVVTLVATPEDGCQFAGWQVAGKLVGLDTTYTFNAVKDVVVTPVFAPADEDKITVIFYDKYANIVASYVDMTVSDFQAEMAAGLPKAPAYPGYEFDSWSYTDEQIKALEGNTTIFAKYTEKAQTFTVKTDADVELTVAGEVAESNVVSGVQFDTKATVTKAGATAWAVDGAIVGYGDTYTFYVVGDIEVTPVVEAVEAEPVLTLVDCYQVVGSHKVSFLATMSIPDGYTLVDHGFVYGKNLTEAEMTLENVGNNGASANAGQVKLSSLGVSPTEQFGISYGVKAMDANACARAFITTEKDGEFTTIYTDGVIFTYPII